MTTRYEAVRYINQFFRMDHAADLVALHILATAASITETMAAYNAMRDKLRQFDPGSESKVAVVSIGDGITPKVAALFAWATGWRCWSIDPVVDPTFCDRVPGLRCLAEKIERGSRRIEVSCERLVVVAIRSHAKLEDVVANVHGARFDGTPAERDVIAIPCCVEQVVPGHEPDFEYTDPAILSTSDTVRVWRNV